MAKQFRSKISNEQLLDALKKHNGIYSLAADELGVSYGVYVYRMKKDINFNLDVIRLLTKIEKKKEKEDAKAKHIQAAILSFQKPHEPTETIDDQLIQRTLYDTSTIEEFQDGTHYAYSSNEETPETPAEQTSFLRILPDPDKIIQHIDTTFLKLKEDLNRDYTAFTEMYVTSQTSLQNQLADIQKRQFIHIALLSLISVIFVALLYKTIG